MYLKGKQMKITKPLISKQLKKVQKNALKHLDFLSISQKMIFDDPDETDSIFNIKINMEFDEPAIAMVEQIPNGEDEPIYKINLNPNMIDTEEQLLEIIAHEVAHFVDYRNCRNSNHDLQFLHLWMILTDCSLDLESVILQYIYDYESEEFDGMVPYNQILEGIKK